jgi:hypothetical protein
MQVIEIVGVTVLELFLHQHLLHMPRLNGLDFKDRAHAILIHKFTELMSERRRVVLPELNLH